MLVKTLLHQVHVVKCMDVEPNGFYELIIISMSLQYKLSMYNALKSVDDRNLGLWFIT